MSAVIDLEAYKKIDTPDLRVHGQVTAVHGLAVEALLYRASVGQIYSIETRRGDIKAEVSAVKGHHATLVPYGDISGLYVGAPVQFCPGGWEVPVHEHYLGRVVDAFGRPIDERPLSTKGEHRPLRCSPPSPLSRLPVNHRLVTGVRSLDAFIPLGRGQRLGVFAGTGVGKSVLMGMLAKNAMADVIVLGLVGERAREVGHFVHHILGSESLKRSVVVVATSDRPAPERVRASLTATAIAEYFRSQGKHVLLMIDSLTRLCMAQREIGLASGEPPTTKGYPPSAFANLAPLLERVAPTQKGSITGLYTVLVEGDDLQDPVADTVRGILDGHIVLSRRLAEEGHFPAVDVLKSLSRVDTEISTLEAIQAAHTVRRALARIEDAQDLISVGAYQAGADTFLDRALALRPNLRGFLCQGKDECSDLETTSAELMALSKGLG